MLTKSQLKLAFLIVIISLKRKWRQIILILAAISVLGLAVFKLNINPFRQNSLSEGIIGTYQETDLPEVATKLLSKGLVEMDEHGRAKETLANWEVNNDATLFTFKLKPNLTWSDGTPVKSQDLAMSVSDVEVTYPDSETIQFKLKDSFSAFPSVLTKPIFKKNTLLGIGPYSVKRIEKSLIFITKITMSSSDHKLPDLFLRFYPNEKVAYTAFSLGEVQSLLGVGSLTDFTNHPQAILEKRTNYSKVVAILYNISDSLLSNRSLRQALSYTAPTITDEIEAKTPIPPTSWAYTDNVNNYLGNFEAGKQALGRAKTNIKEEELQKQINLTVTPQLLDVGGQIVSAWQELGLKVALRVESGIPQNFQALLITQTIPADPDQYSLWHSTQTKTNLTKYSSPRVDKDLEDGRKVLLEEDRKQKYFDFQKTLLEDSPATFLYFPKYNIVYLKKARENIMKVINLQLPSS